MSGLLHAAALALLLVVSLGLLSAHDTEQIIKDDTPVRLVFMMSPGPGGGGGGGGLQMPKPAPRAERKAPVPKKISSPVPLVRRPPPPPAVTPPPRIEPPKVHPPKPTPVVLAPVVPMPADPVEKPGVLDHAPAPASSGQGAGGGTGNGAGTGMGNGQGSGIGDGSGGGYGGGPFRPGSGIEPPTLLREVKPLYTEDARRRGIEGSVVLEIVVRRDGSVGEIRVTRALGAGLDQRAIDAVRQWRFGPARRMGSPVDVIVEVSVGFKLR